MRSSKLMASFSGKLMTTLDKSWTISLSCRTDIAPWWMVLFETVVNRLAFETKKIEH